jgi:hypothetical protein
MEFQMVGRVMVQVGSFILALVLSIEPGSAELIAPTLVGPQNGDILQLPTSPYQLTLSWSNVADATGYLLVISGPPEFGENVEVGVEQSTTSPVSKTLSNFVTGTYTWKVSSLKGEDSVTSSQSFFTVQTGSTGGGDLPAPALLLLPDHQIIRADSAQIRFQWTRVGDAAGYRFGISPPEDGFVDIPQTASGKSIVADRMFTSAQAGTYIWSVTPYDDEGILGNGSQIRTFILTPIDGMEWDLDESDGPSPDDLFAFSVGWQEGFTTADLNSDGLTNAEDLTILFEAEKTGTYPTPTPIPGFSAPVQVSPTSGSTVASTNVQFTWQTLVGAVGYEFNLLDENPNSNIVRVIEQPSSSTVTTTIGFLQARARRWRVRAYFGTGTVGPYSPGIAFNVSG